MSYWGYMFMKMNDAVKKTILKTSNNQIEPDSC